MELNVRKCLHCSGRTIAGGEWNTDDMWHTLTSRLLQLLHVVAYDELLVEGKALRDQMAAASDHYGINK